MLQNENCYKIAIVYPNLNGCTITGKEHDWSVLLE